MFDRIQRSWMLFREAWSVLRTDRELVFFPVLSGIASLLVLVTFLVPLILLTPWSDVFQSSSSGREVNFETGPLHYVGAFLYYLASYFVVVFFNAGLVACVRKRFAGGDPSVGDGLQFAFSHAGLIFKWALLSATVGMILRAIEERASWLGQIVINLIGLLWTLATMFVVPVLVYEGVGPVTAVKRSAEVFRRTWGETVVANFGLSAATSILFLVGLLILIGGSVIGAQVAGAMGISPLIPILISVLTAVVYWVGLSIIHSSLQGIFLTACYEYASTGQVPSAFSPDLVRHAWRPKG